MSNQLVTKRIKIDLFSDTNCEPSLAMRKVMCNAEVGNEVAGEDPTVNRLIDKVCDLLGKEAGIFMPSGTMCNGISFRVWCERGGDRIFFDKHAHAAIMEAGLPGGLVNATPIGIECHRGIFTSSQLLSTIGNKKGYNIPRSRVVSIEQTTNFGGGAVWSLSALEEIKQVANQYKMAVHLDGARLFNAVAATHIPARHFCHFADSVWIDFAKGLGAPMGSVLCGPQNFIDEAWYYKFQQGGAMHQVGILAAGCLYALTHHVERLIEDHIHAKLLAELLSEHINIQIFLEDVETNIVIFKLINTELTAQEVVQRLLAEGIRLFALDDKTLRAIVHMDIEKKDIYEVNQKLKEILNEDINLRFSPSNGTK